MYSVEKGTKVGTHYGIVVKIEKDAVIIDELVSTGMDNDCGGEGSWVKRSVKLSVSMWCLARLANIPALHNALSHDRECMLHSRLSRLGTWSLKELALKFYLIPLR